MIKEAISQVVGGKSLSEEEMTGAMAEIMDGQATPAQIASFLTALRMKGETVEEITGAARVMREKAVRVNCRSGAVVDTCGTGGDGAHTFNISTTTALVVAGAGLTVAKHGNRSVSSQCGSADVLKALGINIEAPKEVVETCMNDVGFGFLFAPLLHTAMKHAIGPRREIGVRTIFNILGPLTNPARATCQVLGVYSAELTEPLARVLGRLGSTRAFVVHGLDGLDEITLTGPTRISELKDGRVETYSVRPEDFSLRPCQPDDLKGGDPGYNAKITSEILKGDKGPRRDIVVFNSAFALVAGGKAADVKEGISMASEAIDSGRAMEVLNRLRIAAPGDA